MQRALYPFFALLLAPLAAAAQGDGPVYRLKANDQIDLAVYGEPEMSKQLTINVGGDASLPFLGSTPLAGMTLKEAEQKITSLYKGDYLVAPQINLNLLNAAEERISVMGAVLKPGLVTIPANTTLDLVAAVDSAGGIAPQADPTQVKLQRDDFAKTYDLTALSKEGAAQVMLKHGDRLTVATNAFAEKSVTVLGEVVKGGSIPFQANGKMDVVLAVAMAGGVSAVADPARITVKRGDKIFSAPLANAAGKALLPGDIVTVPKSRFVGKFVTMMGQVGKPGPLQFPLDGKLDLLTAIALSGGFDRLANQKKVTVTRRNAQQNQSWTVNVIEMQQGEAALFFLAPGDQVTVPVRRF